ncbi:MAG: thioredoxin family protein [Chitinispirillales bacterium]|nr:thioredoxin family protein [Chitinispirillales bacterium]
MRISVKNLVSYIKNGRRIVCRFLFLLFFIFGNVNAFETDDTLSFETAIKVQSDTLIAAITINIPRNYHLYSNPKGPGIGKDLQINLKDENVEFLFAKKQRPKVFLPPDEPDTAWVWAWEEKAVIFAALKTVNFDSAKIQIEGVYCDLSCVPFSKTISVNNSDKPFDDSLQEIYESSQDIAFERDAEDYGVYNFDVKKFTQKHSLFSALLLAFFAGVILNFMPCVLPVLGIKILSFAQDTDKKTAIFKSFAFALGVIFVFLLLAIAAIQLKIWWGQQFQNPVFITILSVLMLVGSLFLFDVFTLSPNSGVANFEMKQKKNSLWGNFIRGVCATILATPCSGPFLGAIIAWALIDNSNAAVFAVFLSVGTGMSAPYVLLSVLGGVKISRKIAKYSVVIKKILALILLLFAVYLFVSANYGKFFAQNHDNYDLVWVDFSPELFETARKNKQSVIVNFTAKWCLNCQFNKISVYDSEEIHRIFRQRNILAMTADLTNENPPAQKLQEELKSKSIPFLAIFDGDDFGSPVVFYDIVSKKSVVEVIEKLDL